MIFKIKYTIVITNDIYIGIYLCSSFFIQDDTIIKIQFIYLKKIFL